MDQRTLLIPTPDAVLSEDIQTRLPLIFGGISSALAGTFRLVDAELLKVQRKEWECAFRLLCLLI
ncbi:MAG TPA: DUF1931 family protein [Streptosporangiaceae bacterium]|jgi:hypothetical protein